MALIVLSGEGNFSKSSSYPLLCLLVASLTLDVIFCHPFKIPKWKWHSDYNGQRFSWILTIYLFSMNSSAVSNSSDSIRFDNLSHLFDDDWGDFCHFQIKLILFCLCHIKLYRNVYAGNKLIKKESFFSWWVMYVNF